MAELAHESEDVAALRMMWRIRLFEEAVEDLYGRGMMHGTMHLSIGEEAVRHRSLCDPQGRRPDHVAPTGATATASPKVPTWAG